MRWGRSSSLSRCNGEADAKLQDLRYAVVDVETTGAGANANRVIEVAVVPVVQGTIGDVHHWLVNPGRPIPPPITRLTGISSAMVRSAPRFGQVAGAVRRVLGGRLFVAHNAGFDWNFLQAEFARVGGPLMVGHRLCTVRLARALLPRLRRHSLDHISGYLGIENPARHRAWGDALATARVLVQLIEMAQSRGLTTLHSLSEYTAKRRPRRLRRALPAAAEWEEAP
ncbi:MAG TPA: 3'-5' exonuclease [Gemmatimonadaceae bacterium]|nr:3'-5' exonuclease [Gemmatimonadaceae bacterium]